MLVGQILSPGATLSGQLLGPGAKLASQIKKKSEDEGEGEADPNFELDGNEESASWSASDARIPVEP